MTSASKTLSAGTSATPGWSSVPRAHPGLERFEKLMPSLQVTEVTLKVAQHQISLMLHQRSRSPLRNREDGVALQESKAIGVESRRLHLVRALDTQRGNLVTQVVRRDTSKRKKQEFVLDQHPH